MRYLPLQTSESLKPLSNIRVLDFTALPPAAACTTLLADLGADVIRVESPRHKGKPSLVIGQLALSRGKRSITLDMRNPASSNILQRMISSIDIVVENALPGTMEERGFGYPQANQENPGIIWCAITGFGQTGPWARHSGHDLSYLAHSGLLGALSEHQPWQPNLPLALQAGALCAVNGIQAALLQRIHTGKGAFIDTSLSEAATWFLNCGINSLSANPLMLPASPDRRLYLCADDRYIAIACAEPRTWQALCNGLDTPELIPNLHQPKVAETTTQTLSKIFRTRSASDWVNLLAPLGAAITTMNHSEQLLDDPQIKARGTVTYVDDTPVPANPVRITTAEGISTGTNTSPPHCIGDDTQAVLETLGFSNSEITAFANDNII